MENLKIVLSLSLSLSGGSGVGLDSQVEWWRQRGRGVNGATELASYDIVGTCRLFYRVKSSELDSGLLPQVVDLNSVATPWTLPHAFVSNFLGVRVQVDGVRFVSKSHLGL